MKMNIYKVKDNSFRLWEFQEWWLSRNIKDGSKIGISWKIGKRRKLRSYVVNIRFDHCDDCGNYTEITFSKGGKEFSIDNHLGSTLMEFTSL